MSRRGLPLLLVLVGILANARAVSAQGVVEGLALAPRDGWTELTIQTQGAVSAEAFALSSPARLVIDVRRARHGLPQTDYAELGRGAVRGIRTSQFESSTVRVVLDLRRSARYELDQGSEWIRVSVQDPEPFEAWSTGAAMTSEAQPIVEATEPPPPAAAQRTTALPEAVTTRSVQAPTRTVEAPAQNVQAPAQTSPFPSVETVEAERRAAESSADVMADTIVLTAVITQLAGTTVYIDQGEAAGLVEGDTLALLSGPTGETLLHVISSSSTRAVLAFVGSPVPMTRGERIRLEPRSQSLRIAESNPLDPSGPSETSDLATREARQGADVSGRVFLDLNALQSTTMWDGAPTGQSRTFLTPTARVSATATNLPGGARIELNARGSYRHTSGGQIPSTSSIRFYDFSVTKTFDGDRPVRVQFGRFYNPYESFSGYWDGGLLRLGGENAGVGAALGYRPLYSNEGFSSELPKFAVFGDIRRVGEQGGFTSDISLHRVTPLQDLEAHTFVGWAGRGWYKKLQWSHEIQVDRVAETGEWVVTEFQAYASTALRERLRVYGRFSRRQPFDFWDPERQLAYQRDGLGTGVNLSWNTGSASADVGIRDADEGPRTTTYSGSLQLSRVGGSRLGFSSWASYWSDEQNEGVSFSPAFTHPFGKSYSRLGYRYYRSRSPFHELDTHALIGSLTAPIGPGLRLSLQGQASWGGNLQSLGLYTGIWKSF